MNNNITIRRGLFEVSATLAVLNQFRDFSRYHAEEAKDLDWALEFHAWARLRGFPCRVMPNSANPWHWRLVAGLLFFLFRVVKRLEVWKRESNV